MWSIRHALPPDFWTRSYKRMSELSDSKVGKLLDEYYRKLVIGLQPVEAAAIVACKHKLDNDDIVYVFMDSGVGLKQLPRAK